MMGTYKCIRELVMHFGLTNPLSAFLKLLNNVLHTFLEKFVGAYFDDILFSTNSLVGRVKHLHFVLIVLRKNQSYANMKKCTCSTESIVFVGYVTSSNYCRQAGEKGNSGLTYP